jgi:predicted anti-sigma-YlaC factor YlaD
MVPLPGTHSGLTPAVRTALQQFASAWNYHGNPDDLSHMDCALCREELSARLDGEEELAPAADIDAHLASCAACRQWYDDAARITRLTRTGVAEPTPDLVDAVLDRVPVRRVPRLDAVLRVVLAVVGISQLGLAFAELLGSTSSGHGAHVAHESDAWNFALGIGFTWVAWRVARAPGLIPTLTAFLGALGLLSLLDVVQGNIAPVRLSSHILVVTGYALVLLLAARSRASHGPGPRLRSGQPGVTTSSDAAPGYRDAA